MLFASLVCFLVLNGISYHPKVFSDAIQQNLEERLKGIEHTMQKWTKERKVLQQEIGTENEEMTNPHFTDLDDIWAAIGALQKEIQQIRHEADEQRTEIDVLKGDFDKSEDLLLEVKMETDILENRADEQSEQHNELVNEFHDFTTKVDILENRADDQSEQHNELVNEFHDFATKIEEEAVAFTVYATERVQYDNGEVVKFQSTYYNLGGHFSIEHGIFTCPYHGIYQFSTTIVPVVVGMTIVGFRRDGAHMAPLYVEDSYGYTHYPSAAMIIECKAGQRIWLESEYDGSYVSGFEDILHQQSLFSGVLLRRLD